MSIIKSMNLISVHFWTYLQSAPLEIETEKAAKYACNHEYQKNNLEEKQFED